MKVASNFEDAMKSFFSVKDTVSRMRQEHNDLCAKMDVLEAEMAALPEMRTPLDDLKRGILDLVEAAGERYAKETFRSQVIAFATGRMMGMEGNYTEAGKPLKLGVLADAVGGAKWPEARAQLVHPKKTQVDDLVFYALCGDAVKAALIRAMDNLTPDELGYDKCRPDEIGPAREEMRRILAEKQEQFDILKAREADLVSQLLQLGVQVESRMVRIANARKAALRG